MDERRRSTAASLLLGTVLRVGQEAGVGHVQRIADTPGVRVLQQGVLQQALAGGVPPQGALNLGGALPNTTGRGDAGPLLPQCCHLLSGRVPSVHSLHGLGGVFTQTADMVHQHLHGACWHQCRWEGGQGATSKLWHRLHCYQHAGHGSRHTTGGWSLGRKGTLGWCTGRTSRGRPRGACPEGARRDNRRSLHQR